MNTALELWPRSVAGGWLSIAGALALGPVTLLGGYRLDLIYAEAALFYFAVCATIIPTLVAFAGRFKFLVWQLAAASLAVSVVIDNLRLDETLPPGYLKEYAGVLFYFWLIATVMSCPYTNRFFCAIDAGTQEWARRQATGAVACYSGVSIWARCSLSE